MSESTVDPDHFYIRTASDRQEAWPRLATDEYWCSSSESWESCAGATIKYFSPEIVYRRKKPASKKDARHDEITSILRDILLAI